MRDISGHRGFRFLNRSTLLTFALLVILPLFYQNCSDVGFKEIQESASAADGDPAQVDTPSPGQGPARDVVCDPFSPGSVCGNGAGLIGSIYHLPHGVGVQSYIDFGNKLTSRVQLTSLDIPARTWTSGFPGPNGLLKKENGEVLVEYFAFDLKGKLTLPKNLPEGNYQFAIASDDGAILEIDGQTVVNNDGDHQVQWMCANQAISMLHGQPKQVRLRYYQGPRAVIALQVFMRPWPAGANHCGVDNGFETIPSAMLSH